MATLGYACINTELNTQKDRVTTNRTMTKKTLSTWNSVLPVVHYSQDRSVEQNDSKTRPQAHSDSYWTPIETYGYDFDVMLECKKKEQGLFKMRELKGELL
jgi:UV DNA damage repair endonuclease